MADSATDISLMALSYSNLKLIMNRITILERVRMQKSCKTLRDIGDVMATAGTIRATNMVITIDIRNKQEPPNTVLIVTYLHREKKMDKTFPFNELPEQINNYKNFYFQKVVIISERQDNIQCKILSRTILEANWKANCLNCHFRLSCCRTNDLPRVRGIVGLELIYYDAPSSSVEFTENNMVLRRVFYYGEHLKGIETSFPRVRMTPPIGMAAEHLALHGIGCFGSGWKQLLPIINENESTAKTSVQI